MSAAIGEDLRVRRTKLLLFNSLEKLLRTTPLRKISINDICKEAMVNRSTFYKHFNDKFDLLEHYISQASESIYQIAKTKIFDDSSDVITVEIIHEMADYQDIIYNILDTDDNVRFNEYLTKAVVEYFYNKISNWKYMLSPNQSIDILSQFYAGGILTVIKHWIAQKDNPNRMSEEELSEQINLLFSSMAVGIHNIIDIALKETEETND